MTYCDTVKNCHSTVKKTEYCLKLETCLKVANNW